MSHRPDRPPPLPSQVFERVVQLSGTDGRLVLWLAGIFAVLAAVQKDGIGALAGVVAAGAGAMELHGSQALRNGNPAGMSSLMRAQLLLLATILMYCAARILTFDLAAMEQQIAQHQEQFGSASFTAEQWTYLLPKVHYTSYTVLGLVAFVYQGLMLRFYARSRAAIEQALSGIA